MKNLLLSVGLAVLATAAQADTKLPQSACEFNGLFGEHGAKHQLGPMSELDF